jgi:predicted DNA-binding transcriptional regulator AlpA
MADQLLTTPELADLLRKSPAMLKLWRHQKRGPAYIKVGRDVRYSQKTVDRWLAAQTRETEAA